MRPLRLLALLLLFALSASAENLAFVGGRWFDGRGFTARTMYSVDGVFETRRPRSIDRTIDLAGKYVVPPYGEAHNHNVADSKRVDALIARYLADGVFYVKNPNSLPRATTPLAGRINTPTSIDVVFAAGGLTSSDGHPIAIVTPQRGFKPEDGEGAFLHIIDTRADLDRKWPAIVAVKRDFLKTYLLYSEHYGERHGKPEFHDWNGLDPALLPEIVRRAHAAGWRVSTHVETAADFRTAVAAHVDEINHLPGFRPLRNDPAEYRDDARYRITAADARAAKRAGVVVVTTIAPGGLVEARPVLTHNLRTLRDGGVRIAVGSDSYGSTSKVEIEALRELGVFSNLELLKMWSESTAATIFPKRKLGRLARGYEASFLALDGNPLDDFANAHKIAVRVKHGMLLSEAR